MQLQLGCSYEWAGEMGVRGGGAALPYVPRGLGEGQAFSESRDSSLVEVTQDRKTRTEKVFNDSTPPQTGQQPRF